MTGQVVTGAPVHTAASDAVAYWRAACALAVAHLFGLSWPPPGRPQRGRLVGHWGCNPGIAWVVGHLAAHCAEPVQLVLGTGHAGSFVFAHQVLTERWDPRRISGRTARHGAPGGESTEPLDLPGLPYWGGELGPALGVSQGLARHLAPRPGGWVVGAGEGETPVALAALAHAPVLLGGGDAAWLPVVNANGARMGGPARFDRQALTAVLAGMGYHVLVSGIDPDEASAAAAAALAGCLAGRPTAWVSVTDKGWPAPVEVAGKPFRGHHAHKLPTGLRGGDPTGTEPHRWLAALGYDGDGPVEVDERARVMAARMSVTLPALPALPAVLAPALPGSRPIRWGRPMAAVDAGLAVAGVDIHSPDEAESNGITRCLAAGIVTEVLAEALCAAWTWGSVQAGRPAAFVTYEAFAPQAGSVLTQYAKLVHGRPLRGAPPLLVVATSPGWANTPSHQSTDLTGMLLARPLPRVRVVYPYGAGSAGLRLAELTGSCSGVVDGLALLVCSKQQLLDPPDPGGPAAVFRVRAGGWPDGVIVAVGDVCVTEALAAATTAAGVGLRLDVVAVAEPAALDVDAVRAAGLDPGPGGRLPVVGVSMCAPHYVRPLMWAAWQRVFPVTGYEERWGSTPWETLVANRMDRVSLLAAAQAAGVSIPAALLGRTAESDGEGDRSGVPRAGPVAVIATALRATGSVGEEHSC